MKRLMVANLQKTSKSRYVPEKFETLLKAQIHNALEVGWLQKNIILLTSFNFEFMGVKAEIIPLNDFCLSGSKMWGLKWLFDNTRVDYTLFSSDLDCWQNCWFDEPIFPTDIAACQYSNPKWNGGNIFWKPESRDIVNKVVETLTENKAPNEEPTLNMVFKSEEYKNRITCLNSTYNVGCSGFFERFTRSDKPVRIVHFHPPNNVAWEIHALDRDGIGGMSVTIRLERLLRRYYDLATELKDKSVPQQKIEQRSERVKRNAEKMERNAEKLARKMKK